jgi:DNA-binding NarL/FixJ family response regulator
MGQPRQGLNDPVSVWIVEDSHDYRETLRQLIDAEPGLTCPHAFRSSEELLAYANGHYLPEVILLDIGLPGIDGIEAVKQMRAKSLGTAMIMLTVHEDNDRILQALCAGASGYLSKTSSTDDIVDAIWDVRRGGAAMSPQIARRVLNMFAQSNTPRFDYGLTDRETEVLNQLVAGKTKKRIGKELSLSIHTVDTHLRSIYGKLHVNTQTAAVAKAVSERLVH